VWRKSSYSGTQGECVEVAFLAADWRKSSYSGADSECVEVAFDTDVVGVRDSKNPTGGVLVLPAAAWHGFLTARRGLSTC